MCLLNEDNQRVYQRIHNQLLHQPTRCETQLNKMMQDPVRLPLVLQQKIWNCTVMYPHYLFDSGLTINLRKEFMKWWKEYYALSGSSVYDVKVRLISDTHRTVETFFIHKKPPKEMLTKMESASTTNN